MSGPTSVVLRVLSGTRKQLARPRGSRGGHTGQVSNASRTIWVSGKIFLHLFYSCVHPCFFIKTGKMAAGLGVGVVLIGNWLEGNIGSFTRVKPDIEEQVIQGRPPSQGVERQTKQEMGKSEGQDSVEEQNCSTLKAVDNSGKIDQENELPTEDKSLRNVSQSSLGSVTESVTDEKVEIRQQSEENIETILQSADCCDPDPDPDPSPNPNCRQPSSDLPLSKQVGHLVWVGHGGHGHGLPLSKQVGHLIWVGLRLAQILLSILLPTTLIFLRWM